MDFKASGFEPITEEFKLHLLSLNAEYEPTHCQYEEMGWISVLCIKGGVYFVALFGGSSAIDYEDNVHRYKNAEFSKFVPTIKPKLY
jgi:hypothetical protein